MIVPSDRALRLFAATAIPAALTMALAPQGRVALMGASLIILALAAVDALRAERQSRRVTMQFPERLVLSRDREGTLPFTVSGGAGATRAIALALQLPAGIASPYLEHPIELAPEETGARVRWPLTGTRRGDFPLGSCRLRLRSPLGLWHAQRSLPARTTLRVYPNLREERRRLATFFANRNDALVRPQRQVGQGREFEKLRLYLPGDSLGDIHWRATAKRGQLVTKEFRIERTQEVYVVIDASRLSGREVATGPDGREEQLLERYLRSALILGSTAQKQGDLFGVMSFSDRVLSFVRARAGQAHFGVCRDALYHLAPGKTNPGFDEAASFLAARLRRRALLIFFTTLEEPALAEEFLRSIGVLSRRHIVCVAMVRPDAAAPLFSGEEVEGVEGIYRALGGHLVWHELRELQQTLRLRGVQLFLPTNERLSAEVVSGYLEVKRRQLL